MGDRRAARRAEQVAARSTRSSSRSSIPISSRGRGGCVPAELRRRRRRFRTSLTALASSRRSSCSIRVASVTRARRHRVRDGIAPPRLPGAVAVRRRAARPFRDRRGRDWIGAETVIAVPHRPGASDGPRPAGERRLREALSVEVDDEAVVRGVDAGARRDAATASSVRIGPWCVRTSRRAWARPATASTACSTVPWPNAFARSAQRRRTVRRGRTGRRRARGRGWHRRCRRARRDVRERRAHAGDAIPERVTALVPHLAHEHVVAPRTRAHRARCRCASSCRAETVGADGEVRGRHGARERRDAGRPAPAARAPPRHRRGRRAGRTATPARGPSADG